MPTKEQGGRLPPRRLWWRASSASPLAGRWRSRRLGSMPSTTLRDLVLFAITSGCVAGSEGPRGPGTPTDPDPQGQADLSAGPVETPTEIRVDAVLEMRVGVRNRGSGSAGPGWVVRVFLSQDPVIDSADIQVDHFAAPRELAPGTDDQYLRHKKLRASTPPGLYFIGSILDVTNVVPESAEGNNTLRTPGTITLIPKTSTPPGSE